MCLAIPGKITEIKGTKAVVDFAGIKRNVDVSFVEDPKAGDYILVHAGFGIQKVNEYSARETYRLLAETDDEKPKQTLCGR